MAGIQIRLSGRDVGFPQGKSKDFCDETLFFFFLHFLAEFMFGIVIFFDCFIAVISRR